MIRTTALVGIVILTACGGSPSEPSSQPTKGGDYVAAQPRDAEPAEEKKADTRELERRRLAEIPPPKGAPPAWLSAPMPAYETGAVLKFAPAACEERVYVNVSALVGADTMLVGQLIDRIAATGPRRSRNEYDTVMRISKDAGVDPFRALREIAACEGKGPDVVVVGVAHDKPVEMTLVFQKVVAALGKPPGQVEREGDVSMFANPEGDEAVAQFGPNVLVFGTKEAVMAAARAKAGAAGFGDAAKHLVRAKTKEADAMILEKGGNIDMTAVIHMRDGGRQRATEVANKIKSDLKETSDRLATTELKLLADRLRATTVAARGTDVTVKGSLRRADLSTLLRSAATADLEQLMRTLKGR